VVVGRGSIVISGMSLVGVGVGLDYFLGNELIFGNWF
jgi:hypothetical protein